MVNKVWKSDLGWPKIGYKIGPKLVGPILDQTRPLGLMSWADLISPFDGLN